MTPPLAPFETHRQITSPAGLSLNSSAGVCSCPHTRSCPPLLPAVPSLAQLPPTERTSLPPSPGPPGVTSALLPPELPRSLFCGPSASRHLYHEGQQCFQITRFLHLLFLSFQILELSIMWVTAVHIPVLAYKHSIDTVEPRRIFPKQNGSG